MSKIILDKENQPFKSDESAYKYIDSELKGQGELVEMGDGFAILETIVAQEPLTYVKCSIAPRTNDNESEIVDLCVQGRQLQVQRGTDVILPESFVHVAENAVVEKYELRGSVLVKIGNISVCPITRIEKATEKAFKKQIKEGNATRDQEIRIMNATERS